MGAMMAGLPEGFTIDEGPTPPNAANGSLPEGFSIDQPAAPAGGILNTAKEGAKGLLRGAAGFAGDMGEAVMGPVGPSHHAANLMADLRFGQRAKNPPTHGQQSAHATGI